MEVDDIVLDTGTEIEKIGSLLSRIDPDVYNHRNECDGISDENVSSAGSVGEHLNNLYSSTFANSFYTNESLTPQFDRTIHSNRYRLELPTRRGDTAMDEFRTIRDAVTKLTTTINKVESSEHELKKENADLKQENANLKNEHADLKKEIAKLKKEIGLHPLYPYTNLGLPQAGGLPFGQEAQMPDFRTLSSLSQGLPQANCGQANLGQPRLAQPKPWEVQAGLAQLTVEQVGIFKDAKVDAASSTAANLTPSNIFSSAIPHGASAISSTSTNIPSNKAAPVNVVITSSDPLPKSATLASSKKVAIPEIKSDGTKDNKAKSKEDKKVKSDPAKKLKIELPKAAGWGDKFKPKLGSWGCKNCFIVNDGRAHLCIACETPRNNTSPKKSANADKAGAQFSFGIPNLTPTSEPLSPSVAEVETTPKQQFSETYSTNTVTISNQFLSVSTNSLVTISPADSTTSTKPFTFALTQKEMEESSKASNENRDQFVFGSPQKHSFEFTPRSPRRHSSGCQGDEESDSFVEDEGDHIYFKPVIPLPEKIDVKTGEEQEEVLYCHRAKLFRLVQGEWKKRGIGDIKILLKSDSGKLRVLMRCEQVLKICLNHILTADIKYLPNDGKTWLFSAPDFSQGEINHWQFCLRFKTADIAQDFKTAVDQALQKTLVSGGASSKTTPASSPSPSTLNI